MNIEDFLLPELESFLRERLTYLEEHSGQIIIAFRTFDEEYNFALMGLAFVPLDEADVQADIESDLSATLTPVLLQALQGSEGQCLEDMPSYVSAMYTRLIERREERERHRYDPITPEAAALQERLTATMEHFRNGNAANKRAEQLLLECLSPEQIEDYNTHKGFNVLGGDDRIYRVYSKLAHNVVLFEEGRPSIVYCVITREFTPTSDQLLAQKLLLETQPEEFLRIANWRRVDPDWEWVGETHLGEEDEPPIVVAVVEENGVERTGCGQDQNAL